ncbi:Ctr copper transporter family-domain-containing protein [Triangularia verruculosa]|uniref:Copper transport protein n=1 Tax=Triangularia verruculosa TaxID=2587418 RepID=A0AAN7ARX9_9PEZI|nr:Ctr copper transporter family-domain-containing protein [Triangularia verruculosa]
MDHSHHDHSHHKMMGHSGHGDHGDHGGGQNVCNMNMLFTWDTTNLCIVFRQWHISSPFTLLLSLLAIVALGAGYEALREGIRRYESAVTKRANSVPREIESQYQDHDHDDGEENQEEEVAETAPFFGAAITGQNRDEITKRAHIIKSVLYAVQNFYAFMIMLVFMTYNGWVMLAVSLGAGLGYLFFGGQTTVAKETACH